jgi:hypothetical protein
MQWENARVVLTGLWLQNRRLARAEYPGYPAGEEDGA